VILEAVAERVSAYRRRLQNLGTYESPETIGLGPYFLLVLPISATPPLLSQKFSSPAVHTNSRAFLVVADNLAAVLAVGLQR
jgi:hypothetical protein